MKKILLLTGFLVLIVFPSAVFAAYEQEQKLKASDVTEDADVGVSAAISADGTRLVLGADCAPTGNCGTATGAAYIFVRSGSTWTEEEILTASDAAAGDAFGYTVHISSDGSRVVVGAYGADISGNSNQGAVYVFSRSGSTWTEEQKLTASDGAADDRLGIGSDGAQSVVISDDGTRIAVAAPGDDVGLNTDQGSIYVFSRSGTTWSQEQKLTASDGAGSDLLNWVDIASDGSRIVAAASNAAKAYVFSRSGTVWSEEQELTSPCSIACRVVSMDDAGTRVAVGDELGDSGTGAVNIFSRSATTWTLEQSVIASDGEENDYFGHRSILSHDGTRLVVGAYAEDDTPSNDNQYNGAAYVFSRSGTIWTEDQKITLDPRVAFESFGSNSISITSDNSRVLFGVASDPDGSGYEGAGYVYTLVIPDTTAPDITILGSNPAEVLQKNTYTDAGATADDDTDGDVTSSITTTGSVDTQTLGTYEIVYSVTDAALNTAYATRTVEVISRSEDDDDDQGNTGSHHHGSGGGSSGSHEDGSDDDMARLEHLITILQQILNFLMGKGVLPH